MHSGSYSVEILRLASAAEQTPALSHVIIIRSVGGIASTLMCPEMRKKLFTDGVLAQIPHWMREIPQNWSLRCPGKYESGFERAPHFS